jgi:hypothetical protein
MLSDKINKVGLNDENRNFPTRDEEVAMIKELHELYGGLLATITESSVAIDAIAHLCQCAVSHELSPSSLFKRGERTAAALKNQILDAALTSQQLADERNNLAQKISDLLQRPEPCPLTLTELQEAQAENNQRAQELIRELNPTNATVDYLAPYLLKSAQNIPA